MTDQLRWPHRGSGTSSDHATRPPPAEIAVKLPTVDFHLPENGYLAWLDLSSLNLGDNPAALLLAKEKVAFVPGDEHGEAYGQFVRINFACRPASIRAAIDKIANQAAKAARR